MSLIKLKLVFDLLKYGVSYLFSIYFALFFYYSFVDRLLILKLNILEHVISDMFDLLFFQSLLAYQIVRLYLTNLYLFFQNLFFLMQVFVNVTDLNALQLYQLVGSFPVSLLMLAFKVLYLLFNNVLLAFNCIKLFEFTLIVEPHVIWLWILFPRGLLMEMIDIFDITLYSLRNVDWVKFVIF